MVSRQVIDVGIRLADLSSVLMSGLESMSRLLHQYQRSRKPDVTKGLTQQEAANLLGGLISKFEPAFLKQKNSITVLRRDPSVFKLLCDKNKAIVPDYSSIANEVEGLCLRGFQGGGTLIYCSSSEET